MDIFKQKRYLWITVVVLLVLNISSLSVLWMGRPEGRRPQAPPDNPAEKQQRIEQLLKVELGFDEAQSKQYLKLRAQHRDQAQQLDYEIRQIKKEMFDEVLKDNPRQELSDSLLTLAQNKQAQLEKLTFQHFLDLKKLCKPEQQDKLKLLMREVFRQGPAPPPGSEEPPPLP